MEGHAETRFDYKARRNTGASKVQAVTHRVHELFKDYPKRSLVQQNTQLEQLGQDQARALSLNPRAQAEA